AAIAIASLSGAVMAVWLRREGWALAAAMGVNLAASLIVWHYRYDDHLVDWWIDLTWANIIASATVGLVWLAAAGRLYPKQEPAGERPLLTFQVTLPAVGQAILCLLPVVWLATQPERLPEWIAALGCPVGWLALGLTVAATGWRWLDISRKNGASIVVASVLGAAALSTCHTGSLADFGSYYFLVTSLAAIGLLIAIAGPLGVRLGLEPFSPRRAIVAWATAVGLLVFVLSLLHCGIDPHRPWWFASTLISVSVAAGLLAWWLRWTVYVFASGLVLNAVGMVVWYARGPETAASPIEVNVLCLGVGSALWSAIGWLSRWRRKDSSAGCPRMDVAAAGYTRLAAGAALLVSIVLAASRVAAGAVEIDHVCADTLSWISLGATAVALVLLLGDGAVWWTRPGLYLAGLSGVGLALDTRWLTGRQLAWTATIDLAVFALAAAAVGWITSRRQPSDASEQETPTILPREMGLSSADLFSSLQQIVVVATAVLAAWVSLDHAFDACAYSEAGLLAGRVAGPLAAALLLAASWVMSGQGNQASRADWRLNTMLVTAAMLCCAGWWRLAADPATLWLHRAVVLMAGTALGAAGSVAIAVRSRSSDGRWFAASRRAVVALGVPGVASLALVMGLEVYFYQPDDGTPMAGWAIATVAATLLGLMAGCIWLAVVPGADPMNGTLRRRTIYVYAAELIGAVLGLHLWLTMPELFRLGIIEKYWQFLVMGVAFVGAGLAEWFQRLRLPVLAEPLERTALALPLVPALGFWFLPEGTPAFWFLASLFYGVLAVGRRSAWMGLAAVVTGNLGLWVLWDRWELNFLDRPQLWLIPAALCALVAEYAHHDRLKEAQSAAIRYMALSVIYVSSTVEFMRGVGESIWLPLVLIGLSLAGVLLGILLRVRSFVYLGVTFLLVVLVRMILYAAFEQGQMWVFWSACVCLGAMIIGLFAVLEKRRNDVLAALDKFRRWEK
ncbi:MAG TPA: hypothetical protein DD670_00740, partial [Planctomycetaceae bacterium]|nr:hypothetical protein [Planctomycetaceae bacterium]